MIKYAGAEFANFSPVKKKQGPPALTNKKKNFDQI
jgi:hypothetical protein